MQSTNKFKFTSEPVHDLESGLVTCVSEDYQSLVILAKTYLGNRSVSPGLQTYQVEQGFSIPPRTLIFNAEVALLISEFNKLVGLAEKALELPIQLVLQDEYLQLHHQAKNQLNLNGPSIHNSFQEPKHKSKTAATFGPSSVSSNAPRAGCVAAICSRSHILNSEEGKMLGSDPLQFLSASLAKFRTAREVFSTRSLLPRTQVAEDFHATCDHVPDVLVIIKSGQYIAGGYTEVPFESREFKYYELGHYKPNDSLSTFVFSANKQRMYPLKHQDKALNCDRGNGPSFGWHAIVVEDDYASDRNHEFLFGSHSSFHCENLQRGELFGTSRFAIDAYEVYRLS